MRARWSVGWVLASALLGVPAGAEVNGSFDGTVTSKAGPPVAVAAALAQAGRFLDGTIALPLDVPGLGGAYLVHGTATPRRLKLAGTGPAGARLTWRAAIAGDALRGKLKLKVRGTKLAGTLALARNVVAGDGSACDAVYAANQAFFDDQVLGQALASCATCHAPGLQARATRLQVVAGDPLATARTVATMVDAADPPASRILVKPLAIAPHGGGQQLVAGIAPEPVLDQWVALLAQAHCY
jgi:hypothetical protein